MSTYPSGVVVCPARLPSKSPYRSSGDMLLRTSLDNINIDFGRRVLSATSKCQEQELLFETGVAERGLFSADASQPTATLTNQLAI